MKRPVVIGGDAAHAGEPKNHADHETALLGLLQKKSAQSPEPILRNRPPRAERRAGSGRADWGVLCGVEGRVLNWKSPESDFWTF